MVTYTSPVKRLCHWGPLASIAIIASITVATLSTRIYFPIIFLFQIIMCLALYNMWCATLIGPGYMSTTSPTESPSVGRFCRRCGNIVLKRHHHCPWINNCVGQNNEDYFIRFLIFSMIVTLFAISILLYDTYQLYKLKILLPFNLFNIGLSIGVLIALSVLLYKH